MIPSDKAPRLRAWGLDRHLERLPAPIRELRVLLALVAIAASIWLFAGLADEIVEGDEFAFDRAVLLFFRNPADPGDPIGPDKLESMVRDVTAMGGTVILTFITLAVAGFLALGGKRGSALFVLAAIGGAILLSFAMKAGFERPRPDLVPHGAVVYTASFPSGHATGAAATYLTLGALLARFQPRRRLKFYILGLAVFMTVCIGLSRIYLGVHWPTDVIAGWTLGASWALLCWLVARALQHQGKVEKEGEVEPETAPEASAP